MMNKTAEGYHGEKIMWIPGTLMRINKKNDIWLKPNLIELQVWVRVKQPITCVFTTFRMTIHKGVNYVPHLHDMMIICLMWDLAMLCEQKSTKNLASMCFREQRIIVTNELKEY